MPVELLEQVGGTHTNIPLIVELRQSLAAISPKIAQQSERNLVIRPRNKPRRLIPDIHEQKADRDGTG